MSHSAANDNYSYVFIEQYASKLMLNQGVSCHFYVTVTLAITYSITVPPHIRKTSLSRFPFGTFEQNTETIP